MSLVKPLFLFFLLFSFPVAIFLMLENQIDEDSKLGNFHINKAYYEGNPIENKFAANFRMAPVSEPLSTSISTAAIVKQMEAAATEIAIKKKVNKEYSANASHAFGVSSSTHSAVVSVSTISYFAPLKGRDPTLSPMDYYSIKKKQEEIENAKREREKQQRIKNKQEMPKIYLQGIVGKSAIINGEMINEGQKYKGFKVIKVGYDYVIGSFQGKRYRMNIK